MKIGPTEYERITQSIIRDSIEENDLERVFDVEGECREDDGPMFSVCFDQDGELVKVSDSGNVTRIGLLESVRLLRELEQNSYAVQKYDVDRWLALIEERLVVGGN